MPQCPLKDKYSLKTSAFILFVSIVTAVYLLVNYYIFIRGLQALPQNSGVRAWYIAGFWFIASTFIAARILERAWPGNLSAFCTWTGSFWLAFMLFFFLFVFLLDLARLLNLLVHYRPDWSYADLARTKLVLFYSALVFAGLNVLGGYINARNPRVRELDLTIDKQVPGMDSLTISVASDIHLGTIIRKAKARELVRLLNAPEPDLILLAGDIVDEDLTPVIKDNIGEALCELKARMGVFAITGNHEFIGGAGPAVEYLEKHCIRVLRDTAVFVEGKLYLAGRDDRDKERFTGRKRKDLKEVLRDVDTAFPLILMDHQPFNLDSAAACGVDLQLSGHTHHGQIWPFNLITQAIYQQSWGYTKIRDTHFYVSCGFGTWGPPVRLGNRPEVVIIKLRFRKHGEAS